MIPNWMLLRPEPLVLYSNRLKIYGLNANLNLKTSFCSHFSSVENPFKSSHFRFEHFVHLVKTLKLLLKSMQLSQ